MVNVNCPPAAVSYKRGDMQSLEDRRWAIKSYFTYYFKIILLFERVGFGRNRNRKSAQ